MTVHSPDNNVRDVLWGCSPNRPVQWETGHGPDLDLGLPEDTFGHFDAVDLREREAVRQAELTVADLAVLYPEVLPVFPQSRNAAPVIALHWELDL